MTPSNVITLRNVTYTSCPQQRADLAIRARELRLDTDAGEGVGRGAVVDFEGIPILYLPWISFPLNDARKSGFLFPELSSSSRNGGILAVPWYWNIAPNQDATFTPTTYYSYAWSRHGRAVPLPERRDRGTLDADYLPHDSPVPARTAATTLPRPLQLPANTRVETNVESVSDTEYFEDFSQGSESHQHPVPAAQRRHQHRDDIWNLRAAGAGLSDPRQHAAGGRRAALHPAAAPDVPRHYGRRSDWPQLQHGFDSELVNFTRSVGNSCSLRPGLPAAAATRRHARWLDLPDSAPGPASAAGASMPGRRSGSISRARAISFGPTSPGIYPVRAARQPAIAPTVSPQRSLPIVDRRQRPAVRAACRLAAACAP